MVPGGANGDTGVIMMQHMNTFGFFIVTPYILRTFDRLEKYSVFFGSLILLNLSLAACGRNPEGERTVERKDCVSHNTPLHSATKPTSIPSVSASIAVQTEELVAPHPRYFLRHQDEDGSWNPATYNKKCTGTPCEPGTIDKASQIFTTALILNCYLGAGYDHKNSSRHKRTVAKGLAWILAQQGTDGGWGRNDCSAVCTMVLVDAYAMTTDPTLKVPAQKAVDFLRSQQNQGANGTLGWDYHGPSTWNDSYVTAWVVCALKSGKIANFEVGESLQRAKAWLDAAWKAANPQWASLKDPSKDCSYFPLRWQSGSATVAEMSLDPKVPSCAPMGGMCAVFLGRQSGDMLLESLSNEILRHHKPEGMPCNMMNLYFSHCTIFQLGGERWKEWCHCVHTFLCKHQHTQENCQQGSWDAAIGFPHAQSGRLLSTALACIYFEIWYKGRSMGPIPLIPIL